jgi:LmbE family N-acetylglucosaminyl deacetylase
MFPDPGVGHHLFTAVFSDEPLPDIEAAIVVAHPGDEAMSASWVMVRLQDRTSIYCLTKEPYGCPGGVSRDAVLPHAAAGLRAGTVAAAALAGVPKERCHNLGLAENELAQDLETLVWLTTAAVSELRPRVLVTHACEGQNLDHDATAFAVHMTAKLMTRAGAAAPVIVELPSLAQQSAAAETTLIARQAVRIEFGPESRKVKRRMLQCHADTRGVIEGLSLESESYVLASVGNPLEGLVNATGTYSDAPWCDVAEFCRSARGVASSLSLAVLSSPSRV